CTLPSLPITAISTTIPSIRARPASGGYVGATSWIRLASATREATRILLTGVGSGVFARTGKLRVLLSASLNTPLGTPPTTAPVVLTEADGASCVLAVGAGMLFEVYAGVGA